MAAAATMFAACSETDFVNEATVQDVPQAIGFDEFVGKSTRGVNTTTMTDYHESFGVWAYKGDKGSVTTPVMDNYNVVYENSAWVYAGKTGSKEEGGQVLKYWDKLKAYEFYAYAPYSNAVTISESKSITIPEGEYAANQNLVETLNTTEPTNTYTGTGATSETVTTDWMVATVVSREKGVTNIVEEVFSHTLSRLIVKLKSTTDAELTINSVSVNNVYGKGSYNNGAWATSGNSKSIQGATGKITGSSTTAPTYYCMEYLVIPSTTAPTFSINYTLNGDTKVVGPVAITNVESFAAATAYEVTVTIGNDPIQFTAKATAWTTPATAGTVTIN